MQLRNRGRSAEALIVVDAWLEEREVLHGTQVHTPFANGTSVRRLPRVDEVQSGGSSGPTTRPPQTEQRNPSIPNYQSNGVVTLLEEYYRLLESASTDTPQMKANRHRSSIMTKIWKLLTITVPTPLRYGQSLRQIGKIVKWTAPSSAPGIIISLLLWLVIIQSLMNWPFLCLVTFLLGVYYLSMGEEKYKEVLLSQMVMEVQLEGFEIGHDLGELSAVAKEYLRIKHHRRLVQGTNLNALEWPEHLPKPNNCVKEEIKEIQKDIQRLRTVVIGPENQKSINSDNTTSFESAVSTVQELCALVGLDQIPAETKDWESLRSKLQELQEELGL